MNREAQTGPAAIPSAQRGERFPSGLRVRGRYRVVSEIGSGAFGTVCVGEDESTGHRVAIRFLPRNVANTPQAVRTVLRTGRSVVAASAAHPALTRVLEFGELDAGRPFTVTEFVEGQRLSEILAGGTTLDVPAVLRLALELGGAIETLHNVGFVHGAISPRNVMVLDDGRVKLLDVELASLRDAREVQELVNSEPPAEYLSPEQIQKGPITEKTDIYAYGVILHELLTGTPPFQGPTRDAIFTKHLREAPVPVHRGRDGVPAPVSRAVTLALYKQPEARPMMGDVLNLLWTGAHGPAPRRRRVAMLAGGAALATVAIGAIVWGVLALRPPSGASTAQPTVLPTIEPPPSALRAVESSKPPAPAATPQPAGQPTVTEAAPSSVRAPEAVPLPKPSVPAESVQSVERAPAPPRPPTASATPETRPGPEVRAAAPPAPAIAVPAPPPTSLKSTVTSRPHPSPAAPSQATAPAPPRSDRREQPETPAAPVATAPPLAPPSTEPDDPRAVIDWLLNPHSQ